MISLFFARHSGRLRPILILVGALFSAALLTVSCEKVPLLAPSGSSITLTSAATALPINGSADIIAQVIEPSGTPPHSGTHVTFTTTLGTIQPSEAETDLGGRVVVKFLAGTTSGTATITAISGGVGVGANGAIKIAIGSAAVGGIRLDANPSTVPAAGGTVTVTATVFDTSGNVLPSVPVTFTTSAGSVGASVVNSDASGRAQTTVTTNRQATVTAAAGVASTTAPSTGTTPGTTTPPATSSGPSTATVTISVNTPTGVTIGTPTPASPVAGQAVTFPLTFSTANATPIARLIVDWGDGSAPSTFTGAPAAISHTFNVAGSFLVRVSAIDTFGDPSTATAAVTVGNKPQPTVTISASPNPTAGTTTTFTITATPTTGNTITSVRIDFGDGSPPLTLSGNATSVQHVYTSSGTFTVTALATDSSGAPGGASTVIVVGASTVASFTVSPASPKVGVVATFDGSSSTSSANIITFAWNFGDGTIGAGVTFPKTYTTAGTFTVTLTITDAAGHSATTPKSIVVVP